jgi:large subunit ribosomal protein L2
MGLKVNDEVIAGGNAEIKPGNTLPLRNILPGTPIHNIEIIKGAGGQLVRSAGALAQIMAKEGDFAQVKLSSGEIRLVHLDCMATIGQVGNTEHETISIGKAGRRRHMGRKPRVRARAMNPHDHPLGGGEGKSAGGRHPCSPKGIPAKGFKTRKKKRYSNRYIIKRRK